MGFFDFIKSINGRTSMDKVIEDLPDLYRNLPDYLHKAVVEEVSTYNFTQSKKEYIAAKIEGSLAGTYYFDEVFISKLASLSSREEKIKLIRDYLRAYVKREINLESANIIKEARNKIINSDSKNPKSIFQIFDPRWKAKAKKGDYSQFAQYRNQVVGYLFPKIDLTTSESADSEHKKDVGNIVKEFKDSGGTAFVGPSERLGGSEAAQNALNGVVNSRYKYITSGTEVFNSEYGGFLTATQQVIISNIQNLNELKANLTKSQIIELMKHVEAGNVDAIGQFLKKGTNAIEALSKLSDTKLQIQVNSRGEASVTGTDGLRNLHNTNIAQFGKRVSKDSTNAIIDIQQSNAISNISNAKSLIQSNRGADTSDLSKFVEQNQLISDILNLSKALQDQPKLSDSATKSLDKIKERVLGAVSTNKIIFSTEEEKQAFVRAIKSADAKYIKKLVTPGLLGTSFFSKMVSQVNDQALDIAGKYNSNDIAVRSLNFNNYISVYKSTILNSYIYAAQLGFDSGYLVSEIKNQIKSSKYGKLFNSFDTTITWDGVKGKLRTKSIDLFAKIATAAGAKNVSKETLGTILDLYSGKTTYRKLIEGQINKYTKQLFDKFKVSINKSFAFTWKEIQKSALFQKGKLKLLKNLRYLEKFGGLAFKKITGPIPVLVGKLLGNTWGGLTRYAGGLVSRLGNVIFPKNLFGSFDSIAKYMVVAVVVLLIPLLAFYLIFVLVPMMVLTAANNSVSSQSTMFQIGAVNDIQYATFQAYNQNILALPTISSSGNVCLRPTTQTGYSPNSANWNNLRLSDFDGTDNTNNCKVMCNARKLLGGLSPGSDGGLNCNINRDYIPRPQFANQYVCADFIVDAYYDDDPDMTARGGRLVIAIDKYLKDTPSKYEKIELAVPNNINATTPAPTANLGEYNYICNDLTSFQPGNILIIRANTCNDEYTGGKYTTVDNRGIKSRVDSGHIEMVLKVVDSGSNKILWTLNANNWVKKSVWPLTKCESGNNKYRLSPKGRATVLRGSTVSENGESVQALNSVETTGYPCRIYQMKQRPNMTCFDSCQLTPNNYPDGATYQRP